MSDRVALKTAIDLMHVPSQVRLLRSQPLPDGVPILIRIAAGDDEAENTASLLMDRPRELVRQAAGFFIEQVMFAPNADSYRVLGTNPEASASDLRRNVALLLRWLHPDLDQRGERSIFVGRVTAAWNDLKTPERRAAYDEQLRLLVNRSERFRARRNRSSRWQRNQRARNIKVGAANPASFFRRAFSMLFHGPSW